MSVKKTINIAKREPVDKNLGTLHSRLMSRIYRASESQQQKNKQPCYEMGEGKEQAFSFEQLRMVN